MCVFSVELRLKDFEQTLHLCGFSSVWMILCLQRVLACRKPLPQTLQMKGRTPVCTGMCLVRL